MSVFYRFTVNIFGGFFPPFKKEQTKTKNAVVLDCAIYYTSKNKDIYFHCLIGKMKKKKTKLKIP